MNDHLRSPVPPQAPATVERTAAADASREFVSTRDAFLTSSGPGRVVVGRPGMRLEVSVGPDAESDLDRLVVDLLAGQFVRPRQVTSPRDRSLFTTYGPLLERLELLLPTELPDGRPVRDPAEAELYAYLARRSSAPAALVAALRTRSTLIVGPDPWAAEIRRVIDRSGLAVVDPDGDAGNEMAGRHRLVIAVDVCDTDALHDVLTQRASSDHRPWARSRHVPVTVGPRRGR